MHDLLRYALCALPLAITTLSSIILFGWRITLGAVAVVVFVVGVVAALMFRFTLGE